MCTLHDFLSNRVRFIHTSPVTGSHSCSIKKLRVRLAYILLSYYFHPLINKPTGVNDNKASTIDNIYTNISYISPPVSGIFKTSLSHHYSIFCNTHFNKILSKAKVITKREISNMVW